MKFLGVENKDFFEPKTWWKYIYWLLKSSCFELFGNSKYSLFETKGWCKDDISWLLKNSCFGLPKSSCFELFGDGKYGLFLTKKVDVKVIFSWSFWAFYDIPGPVKQGFFRSVTDLMLKRKQDLTNPSYFYSLTNIRIFKSPLVHLSQSFFEGISPLSSHPPTLFLANVYSWMIPGDSYSLKGHWNWSLSLLYYILISKI